MSSVKQLLQCFIFGAAGSFACDGQSAVVPWHSQCGEAVLLATEQPTVAATVQQYQGCFDEQPLTLANEPASASISATAYLAQPLDPQRPLLFLFNGGPGSSSSMLQFDGVGPKQKVQDNGSQRLQDNPHSLLPWADLVFIDPPGTGFSVAPTGDTAQLVYWSSAGDAHITAAFIRQWLVVHQRQASRVFIGGESYGGYRLASMSSELQGINVAGLLFISPLLDGSGSEQADGNVLPYIMALPSMAIAAAVQGTGPQPQLAVERLYEQTRHYALTTFAPALLQGRRLAPPQRQQVADELATMLGVPADLLLSHGLKLDPELYRNQLLAAAGKVFGRLDSRDVAPLPTPTKDRPSALDDPSLGLKGALVIKSALYSEYLQQLTGISRSAPYYSLNLNVNFHWQFAPKRQGFDGAAMYFNPTTQLASLAREQPQLKLLVLAGFYDLAVPALSVEYALEQADVPAKQLRFAVLKTGHSVFSDAAERPHLTQLLQEFLQ